MRAYASGQTARISATWPMSSLPDGGMPWISSQRGTASGSTAVLWCLPRRSIHMIVLVSACPLSSTAVVDVYWLVTATSPMSSPPSGDASTRAPGAPADRRPPLVRILLDPAIRGRDDGQHLTGTGVDAAAVVDHGDLDPGRPEIDRDHVRAHVGPTTFTATAESGPGKWQANA